MYNLEILALSAAGLANGLVWYWRNRLRRRRYNYEYELFLQSKKEEAQHALWRMERQLASEEYERRAQAWLAARQNDAELIGGNYEYEAADGYYVKGVHGETYRYRDQDVIQSTSRDAEQMLYADGGNYYLPYWRRGSDV